MAFIEQKNIKNKPFFYLSGQVKVGKVYKKIKVYIGSTVPKDLSPFFADLKEKEKTLVQGTILDRYTVESIFSKSVLSNLESARLDWKYFIEQLSLSEQERLWTRFAVQFIFESNAIEGSRLSANEVDNIVRKKYVKKSLERREIKEVHNALKAFSLIRSGKFKLNERSVIALHGLVTESLNIAPGYKTEEIIVNNKPTVAPGHVRESVGKLYSWYKTQLKSKCYPLIIAADFHDRFEYIHPFIDGNGRVGRLLFIWMLLQAGLPPILFRYSGRRVYFSALNQADEGRKQKWHWLCVRVYKKTAVSLLNLV